LSQTIYKILTKHILNRSIKALLALQLMYCMATAVFAEGSRDMIANGGHRAFLLSTSVGPSAEYNPFPTLGTVKVYAKPGEKLYLGSSAVGIGNGGINVRAPQGTGTYSTTTL